MIPVQNLNKLSSLATSYWKTETILCAWDLGIFERLKKKNLSFETLINQLGTDESATFHLISALEKLELVEFNPLCIKLTEFGNLFAKHSISNPIHLLKFWEKEQRKAWKNLSSAIRSGKEQFSKVYGSPLFKWLDSTPSRITEFYSAYHIYALMDYSDLPQAYEFPPNATIMDVGGGIGTLLQIIASPNKSFHLVLFDLPKTVEFAKRENFDDRITYVPGSFFDPILPRADIIILARVIHDWPDQPASQILKNCRNALNSKGKILLIERIYDKGNYNPFLQLNLLVLVGGKERTMSEYINLLKKAELQISRDIPLKHGIHIIECVPEDQS